MDVDQAIEFSAIVDRPPVRLPGGAHLVVWVILVPEAWDISRPMPRQAIPPPATHPVPDYANWSWHEYGARIGFWRLKSILDKHGVVPGVSINSAVCRKYPRIARACREAKWEFIAHGVTQRPAHELADERAAILEAIDEISQFAGARPRGWASPGLVQTEATLDHLRSAGIEYVCDWLLDDQPCEITTPRGMLLAIPYTADLNDVPIMVVQRQPPTVFCQSIRDAFDRLYSEGEVSGRILPLVLHPYVSGASHRIKYIDDVLSYMKRPGVLFWTGEQILDWYQLTREEAAGPKN